VFCRGSRSTASFDTTDSNHLRNILGPSCGRLVLNAKHSYSPMIAAQWINSCSDTTWKFKFHIIPNDPDLIREYGMLWFEKVRFYARTQRR